MTVPDSGPNRGDISSLDDDEDNDLTSGDGNHSGDGPDTDDRYTTNKPRLVGAQDELLSRDNVNGFNLTIRIPTNSVIENFITTASTAATIVTTTTTTTTSTEPSTVAQTSTTTTETPTSAAPLSPSHLFVDQGTSNILLPIILFYFNTHISHRLA